MLRNYKFVSYSDNMMYGEINIRFKFSYSFWLL